ncbi:hypothetical protein [Bacillus mycoides]|uniref:Uncharacterized protein n=1 Tax=Bacillus mycoides TaxID=1405 RepID=A0AAP8KTZ1_BACMY|nr:hypothetical protein [Bacillus mycoides]PJN57585.1 hypothetical protein BAWEI_54820 [Bacillus mycoides]PJN69634.1 hypothetical protein BACWE_34750 [Bacillus mycoides]QWI35822.1 hypothetical protein EXW43_00735 [Bacillus mycoides]
MEFSIEQLANKIHHHKTKQYFEEVLRSFENENYRSSVVMLYTVVICDLVFKLKDLKEIYGDSKAAKILEDLENQKDENPVSSEWENKLIDKSFKEAKILENDVYTHIDTLKKYRNLSAHPVLNSMDILYRPNKELVEALIKNMLEGLLTKHPLFTKKVFVPFMEEVERIKSDFPNEEKLEIYLNSKFFIHFNNELIEYMFKNIWKCVFQKEGENEVRNREINYKVLLIIYKKYKHFLYEYIGKESAFFSGFLDKEITLTKIIDFLFQYPEVYRLLEPHTQELLKKRAKNDSQSIVRAVFVSDTLKEHFKYVDSEIHMMGGKFYNTPFTRTYLLKELEVTTFYNLAKEEESLNEFYELMIRHYYHSGSYDGAHRSFELCIRPFFSMAS